MTDAIDEADPLDALDPPPRKDFRRVSNGVPMVKGTDGKSTRYSRMSSIGKILDDDAMLVDWRIRKILVGAAYRPDILAEISTLDADANKREFRELAESCLVAGKGRERANKGTAIHKMLDHVDSDADWEPAPPFVKAINAYLDALTVYGLVVADIECQCVNDMFRLAGTMDRRYRTTRNLIAPDGQIVPIGSYLAADTKTGQSLEYASGSYATQLAGYADSVRYDVATDERTPFDPPTFRDWALIMHVVADAGTCDVYWVDLNAGRIGVALSHDVRQWRKRTDLIAPSMPPLRTVQSENRVLPASERLDKNGTTAPLRDEALTTEPAPPVLSLVPPVDPRAPMTADMADAVRVWLRGRVDAIRAHSADATATLVRRWPPGVPGLKHSTQTNDELRDIETVINQVEAKYSIPFGQSDPRTEPRGSTWVDKWAKPTANDVPSMDEFTAIQHAIETHPRRALLAEWSQRAITGGLDPAIDNRYPLAHALYEFATVCKPGEWSDDDVTEMLDGSLRGIGYSDGIDALGRFKSDDAPLLMSAAFAIAAGTFVLRYVDGKPVVLKATSKNTKG